MDLDAGYGLIIVRVHPLAISPLEGSWTIVTSQDSGASHPHLEHHGALNLAWVWLQHVRVQERLRSPWGHPGGHPPQSNPNPLYVVTHAARPWHQITKDNFLSLRQLNGGEPYLPLFKDARQAGTPRLLGEVAGPGNVRPPMLGQPGQPARAS